MDVASIPVGEVQDLTSEVNQEGGHPSSQITADHGHPSSTNAATPQCAISISMEHIHDSPTTPNMPPIDSSVTPNCDSVSSTHATDSQPAISQHIHDNLPALNVPPISSPTTANYYPVSGTDATTTHPAISCRTEPLDYHSTLGVPPISSPATLPTQPNIPSTTSPVSLPTSPITPPFSPLITPPTIHEEVNLVEDPKTTPEPNPVSPSSSIKSNNSSTITKGAIIYSHSSPLKKPLSLQFTKTAPKPTTQQNKALTEKTATLPQHPSIPPSKTTPLQRIPHAVPSQLPATQTTIPAAALSERDRIFY